MNGYKVMADAYKKALEQGQITEAEAKANIKVYELLAELTEEELYIMVDSTAFNDIIKTFCRTAIRNACVDEEDEDGYNERTIEKRIMNELRFLFDEKTAKEVCENN